MGNFIRPSIVRNGLILHLDAANPKSYIGTGTTVNDLSGNGYNGTLINGLGVSTTNAGVFTFDGVNDWINCGTPAKIGSTLTGLTVAVWIKPTVAGVNCIAENGDSYATNTFYMFQENATELTFNIYGQTVAATNDYSVRYCASTYQINNWYYFVGTWTSGGGFPNVYLNGVLSNGRTGGNNVVTPRNGNTPLGIGARPNTVGGAGNFFAGNMGMVQMYDRALTATEILQNYNATKGRFGL